MPIETVRRFYCRLCDYMIYDEDKIKWIEKFGGKCPACNDGEFKCYTKLNEVK